MSDLHVLMLSWEFPPRVIGGLAAHVYDLSRALVRRGLRVDVVTCDFPGALNYEEIEGVHVYRADAYTIPSPDFASWALLMNLSLQRQATETMKKEETEIDLIHAHDWLSAPAGIAIKHITRKPLVATIHSTESGRRSGLHSDYQRMIHEIEWWLTFEAWRIICCSVFMRNQVHHLFSTPVGKIDVIPNGVDGQKLALSFNREEVRSRFAAPWEKIVLFVGRLVPEKGVNILVGAVPKVLKAYPNVKFVIVGDGYMRKALMDDAHMLGVYHKIYFTGFLDDQMLRMLYRSADLAVFPSLYEPFGIVALEAMAAGLPVIVSDTGGFSEIVDHEVNGIKVPPNNSDALAWWIIRVLSDPSYSDWLKHNALKKISDIYEWDKIAEKTKLVYERILKEYDESAWKRV
ncbi:glycosyltransferase family 4 protein [Candidatus Bathyarchaeota archaeon]|nr:glycosyltransferase family 4 protein [Candidatus Bathyarchaeota archaeon]